jgi:hypothetical protein
LIGQRQRALQLTLDRQVLSADVDLFSEDDEDLGVLVQNAGLDKSHGGLYLEPGFELSFRTSPRWRQRAISETPGQVTITVPHPIDILIGKLDRLDPKDFRAFERVKQLTNHPTAEEILAELQNAVDLVRDSMKILQIDFPIMCVGYGVNCSAVTSTFVPRSYNRQSSAATSGMGKAPGWITRNRCEDRSERPDRSHLSV